MLFTSVIGYLQTHWRWCLIGLLGVAALTAACLKAHENFPLSHFPMYGNPQPNDVDYYFLTDASGEPLSTVDYARMTAPQIKKRISSTLRTDAKGGRKKISLSSPELDAAALLVLTKMREDTADPRNQPLCLDWPAGVQLKQGLVVTTPEGFRENFRTVAKLPDAGPTSRRLPPPSRPPANGNAQMLALVKDFALKYSLAVLTVFSLLLMWKRLPAGLQGWLQADSSLFGIGRLEAFAWRSGLALIFWQVLQVNVNFDSLPHPQGLAHWESWRPAILWMGRPEHWDLVQRWAIPLLLWYVLGWGHVVPLTLLTLVHILQRTLYASQGAPHHGHNLTSLVFCAQTLVAWGLLFWPQRWRAKIWRPAAAHWLAMAVVIASSYVITACSKWDESDGQWLRNSQYFSNQIVKTYRQNYYNDLNPQYLVGAPPVAASEPDPANDRYRHPIPVQAHWLLTHPLSSRLFFGLGFLMEFSAFLLLFHRRLAALYGMAIIAFHFMVLWLMELTFPQNIEIVLVLCINLPGWLIWWKFRRVADGSFPSPPDPSATNTAHESPVG